MYQKVTFSFQRANALKGILAICVLISHVYSYGIFCFENTIMNFLFGSLMGYLPVSIFFFLSGYGLESSYEKKGKGYINTFLHQKILPFYAIYIILVMIYAVTHLIVGNRITLIWLIKSLTYGGTIVTFGWFLQTILVSYFIFWLSYLKDVNPVFKIILMTIGEIVFCIIAYIFRLPTTWYATSLCFCLGIYWKYFEEQIIEKIRLLTVRIVVIVIALGGAVSGIFVANKFFCGYSSDTLQVMLTSIFLSIVVILVVSVIKCENVLTTKLGEISFEIYVFQGIFFMLLKYWKIEMPTLELGIVICGTIGVSCIMHPILKNIKEKLAGHWKKREKEAERCKK